MHAIRCKKPAIALWLLQHRGQHDVDTTDVDGRTALYWASKGSPLRLVQALVAAGANPAALDNMGCTPLMYACGDGRTYVVAFLLQLPAVQASIDHISPGYGTALSLASLKGYKPIVKLLLDAGADSTIPGGRRSPLNRALRHNHHTIAALLRHSIAEADRACALHKARSLHGAVAASLACLEGRVEQGRAIPLAAVITLERHRQHQQQLNQHLLQLKQLQQLLQERQEHQPLLQLQQLQQQWQGEAHEKLRATVAFAVGVSGGKKDSELCEELYMKLLGYMLPAWADKGPAGV